MDVGEYVLVIEDDQGNPIAKLRQVARTTAPDIGHATTVDENDTPDATLHGLYRVRDVHLVSDPNPASRRSYKIPYVYVRRGSATDGPLVDADPTEDVPMGDEPNKRDALPSPESPQSPDERADLFASVAEDFRELATELGEEHDELALAVRESNGQLDPALPDRLHNLSRRAKQRYAELILAPAKPPRFPSTKE